MDSPNACCVDKRLTATRVNMLGEGRGGVREER